GKLLWQHPRSKAMTWSTPIVVRVGDHDELVFAGGGTVKGYDPATGKELWSLAGPTIEVVPTIVVGCDVIYTASGRNGPTLARRPQAGRAGRGGEPTHLRGAGGIDLHRRDENLGGDERALRPVFRRRGRALGRP